MATGLPIADSHSVQESHPAVISPEEVPLSDQCSFKKHRKMNHCLVFVVVTSFLVIVFCPLLIVYSLIAMISAAACR